MATILRSEQGFTILNVCSYRVNIGFLNPQYLKHVQNDQRDINPVF